MKITKEEQEILQGKLGEGMQKALELQVALGEAFDAERFVDVSRTHVALSGQEGDTYWCELLVKGGAKCKVPCTTNPAWDTKTLTQYYGVTQDELELVKRTYDVYTKIGAVMSLSCTPELQQNVPAFGEVVAFSESSCTPYVNSVLGARSNRESSVSALAAAVTGKTPLYGLMFDENRRGTMVIEVEEAPKDAYDWGLLGYKAGRIIEKDVPVFVFKKIDGRPTPESLLYFGAELNTSGAVPMYHIVGVTPEAPDLESALRGNKPTRTAYISKEDIREEEKKISEEGGKINLVMLGCPHYTLDQVMELERLMDNRKSSVPFWVLVSEATLSLAKRNESFYRLAECGVNLVAETCIDEPCFKSFEGGLGLTDSPKCAYYRERRGQLFVLRRLSECVEGAIKGEVK